MKKFEVALLFGLVFAILLSCISGYASFSSQCNDIRSEVFRLHVLANSDSKDDQALKLKVRDKILSESGKLFGNAKNKGEAEKVATANLDEIRQVAQQEVYDLGYKYEVKAEITNMFFTTKQYADVTMPAGNYDALRITIGVAKGHNWWCVMFPPLCLPAAQGKTKMQDVLNPNQVNIVKSGKQPQYEIRFKIVEWVGDIKNWFKKK
jgi:stage II sporulation protein R